MYRARHSAAHPSHRIATGLAVWMICVIALVGSDVFKSARAGELSQTVSLLPEVHQALSWASDKPIKQAALLGPADNGVVINGLLKKHREGIASIQRQQAVARSEFDQRSMPHRLVTTLPYSFTRLVSLVRLMKHYTAIASLQSKLIMSGTQQSGFMSTHVETLAPLISAGV